MTLNQHSTHRDQNGPPFTRISFIDDRAPGEWLDDELDSIDECEGCANEHPRRMYSGHRRRNSAALLPSSVLRTASISPPSTDRAPRQRRRAARRSEC